ncbi:hypothetical protein Nepgr_011836 [Nepenthes gracilis]|uniref:Methyltransferase n=1 Tax=Nepenthes gracilis TaxID=150966 RepID=A0AAD3SES8_NEPGR|nr:hypothetical protein Nepgr_011836 [Nepenthes gracilis]
MDSAKPSILRNILVKMLLFCVSIICLRFAYVVTIRGESCDIGDFCFFSLPENLNFVTAAGTVSASAVISSDKVRSRSVSGDPKYIDIWNSKDSRKAVQFYSSVFQDLISEGFLSPGSKSLCVETPIGLDVFAMREIGVSDAIGVAKKASKPLVVSYKNSRQPFGDNTFDFVFSGGGSIDRLKSFVQFADEIARTLKPEGYLVVHTQSNDSYSLNSFISLFNCCKFIRSREIAVFDSSMPYIREIVVRKESGGIIRKSYGKGGNSVSKCSVLGYMQKLIQNAEPLIAEEPMKPWLTLKRNIQNIKYLPSVVDISFKGRYVYVDVGARSYGSSIGSWFRKQYPKQNRTFEIYAIEADKAFHEEYKLKKGVHLLPYAAWIKNETLFFEINHDPGDDPEEKGGKGKGMGRIKRLRSSNSLASRVDKIKGFDFTNWLKNTVSERDFVVMKMDVEGTEFDLIPRLFDTGAICLIDEIFLECHYNRWQRCCPGQRSTKYEKTYRQCLDLFTSLRDSGVLVHQWW